MPPLSARNASGTPSCSCRTRKVPTCGRKLPLDGSIIIEPIQDDPHLAALRERHLPWVSVGRPFDGEGWFVDNDNDDPRAWRLRSPARRRRTAHRPADRANGRARGTGVDRVLPRAGAPRGEGRPPWWSHRAEGHERAIADLLDRPERPDGVFCLFEGLTLELLQAAGDRGIRIPQDLLVVAAGDVGVSAHTDPPLTTVDYDAEALGAAAVELLTDQLEGDPRSRTHQVPADPTDRAPIEQRPLPLDLRRRPRRLPDRRVSPAC